MKTKLHNLEEFMTLGKESLSNEQTSELENKERLRLAAKNIIDCFDFQPTKESLLVVTDTKVMELNQSFIESIQQELEQRTSQDPRAAGGYELYVIPASPKSATPLGETIGKKMLDRPVLIVTSMSRSHSSETGTAIRGNAVERSVIEQILSSPTFTQTVNKGWSGLSPQRLRELNGRLPDSSYKKMKLLAKSTRSRIISITKGHNPYDILTKGAVLENVEVLRERADKIQKLMRDVNRVHITTELGTDLWLKVRPEYMELEDGRLNKPGQLSNYPIGEWSCSPDWQGSDGILIVDGPCGGNINQDILDKGQPLRLTIQNGEVVRVEGSTEAKKLWVAYLDSGNNRHNDAYRLAEFGVGTNRRALEAKPREYWGSSEGEKKYGTVHIAVGSNGSFGREPGTPNFNSATVHCDMVIGLNSGGEVTVECERNDGSMFKFIEKGEPQEY
ncbi:MAG: aminopeptidase [Candidatus Kerfeldbacteria bacterium]|nr:aminopeptidase [Candidatus Kerfeldbacteria bacterium]